MLNPELEKSKVIRDKYKEFNKNTEEKCVTIDTKLRSWTFSKTKIDPNAIKMCAYIKSEKQDRKKVLEPKLKKKPVTRFANKKSITIDKKRLSRLFIDFEKGMTHAELGAKYNATIRAVKAGLSEYRVSTGIRILSLDNKKLISMINKGMTQTEIAKKLDKKPNTINYHIKNLRKSGLIK